MPYVYKYTDKADNKVKYVGLIKVDTNFPHRFYQHRKDWWYADGDWSITYTEVTTQTDAEALEAHLIEYYKTTLYYNRAKAGWGLSEYLPDPKELVWKTVDNEQDGEDLEDCSAIVLWEKIDKLMRKTLDENAEIRDQFKRNSLYLWFVECGDALMRKTVHLSKEECYGNYKDFSYNYGDVCEGVYFFPDQEEFWTEICKIKVTNPYRCKEYLTTDMEGCLRKYYGAE